MANKKEGVSRYDDTRLDKIMSIMKERKINATNLAELTQIRRETLYRVLNGTQPLSMKTLEVIAKALGVPLITFSSEKETNEKKQLQGTSYEVVKAIADLFLKRDILLSQEAERTEAYKQKWESHLPLSLDDFQFRCNHKYDTSEIECWSFNSGKDVRDSINLQLGNMGNEFGVKILDVFFPNSEVPYQLAIFRDTKEALEVQREASNDKIVSNGLGFKRKYIRKKEYTEVRRDMDFELGKQMWCYEWMKFIVWEKCKQNKGFRDILLSIPRNAIIIEQAQHKNELMWGCWNDELKHARDVLKRTAMIENCVKKSSKKVMEAEYKVNNIGVWKGQNAMGQILTMCKICLYDGVKLPIDIEVLNEAKINWFGRILFFEKDDNGGVSVKAL